MPKANRDTSTRVSFALRPRAPTRRLTPADLIGFLDGEPRAKDLRIAEELGFARPRKIRDIIARHAEALLRLGGLPTTKEPPEGGGHPAVTYWLNKRQALYLCTKSETPFATAATIRMVEVFDVVTSGGQPQAAPPPTLPSPPPAPPRAPAPVVPPATDRRPLSMRDLRDTEGTNRAIMSIGGHTVLVDLDGWRLSTAGELAVVILHDGTMAMTRAWNSRAVAGGHEPWRGERCGEALPPGIPAGPMWRAQIVGRVLRAIPL